MDNIFSSQIADATLRDKVRRIHAPKAGAEFRTRAFHPPYDGNEMVLNSTWYEAWMDKDTGLWTVEEYRKGFKFDNTRLSGSPTTGHKILWSNISLFDALYECARFEVDEQELGEKPDLEKYAPDEKHIRAFAKRAGIPFGLDDLPYPVAGGRLLVSGGSFTDEELALARAAKNNLAAPREPKQTTDLVKAFAPEAKELTLKAIESAQPLEERQDAVAQARQLADRARDIADKTEYLHDYDSYRQWASKDFKVMAGVVAVSFVPLLGQLIAMCALGDAISTRRSRILTLHKKFQRAAEASSPALDREPYLQFLRDSRMVYHALCLRADFRDIARNPKLSEKRGRRIAVCKNAFIKLAQESQMDPAAIEERLRSLTHQIDSKESEREILHGLSARARELQSLAEKLQAEYNSEWSLAQNQNLRRTLDSALSLPAPKR
jgi:hypothetical protein